VNKKQKTTLLPDLMAVEPPILAQRQGRFLSLVLNRPRVINTLNLEMVRLLRRALEQAREDDVLRLVLLSGAGDRGFCAGGDLKELAQALQGRAVYRADQFFREEYELDLLLHQFPKPVLALADGICMGGGLGLAAEADFVVVTERSRLALPETRIGFFPDVGATGWLHQRCPPGYPEYLALTGYEVLGGEAVRLGLASHLAPSARLAQCQAEMRQMAERLPADKDEALRQLKRGLDALAEKDLPSRPELDAWVAQHFAGKTSLGEIVASLKQCSMKMDECREVFQRLSERSPTALAVTLKLLRANKGRPLPEVFQREALAAHFMIQHPDYLEGIRARVIDKDDNPRWQPGSIEELGNLGVEF
jgi:enoyl-CoA hydratase/carnithine racemase